MSGLFEFHEHVLVGIVHKPVSEGDTLSFEPSSRF